MRKMNLFSKLIHKFHHLTGQNTGNIVSWHDNGVVYVAFMCSGCGQIDQKTIEKTKFNEENEK